MKQALFFATLILAFLISPYATAEEIFSIGKDDRNYQEFANAGNYADAAKNFPDGTTFQIGKSKPKTAWPFIQPGPNDVWAGRKSHTYAIEFDLPPNMGKANFYELLIQGWGHPSSPPNFKIQLNDKTVRLTTNRDARTDAVLTNPAVDKPGVYSVKFPVNAVKPSGNVLTITSFTGAWFLYDSVRFQTRTGRIESVAVTPERGIFKYNSPQGVVPARKITVDYQGECLDKPAWLEIEYQAENAGVQKVRLMLNPNNHLDGAEALLPMTEADCMKPVTVKALLDIQGRKIRAAETQLPAERKWEVHLIHQTHLDVGYTHTQVDVLDRQVQSLHEAIQYIEETKNYPDEAKFRFHPEGMWAVEEFFRRATDEQKAAFIAAAKTRSIHLDVMYAQAMTGIYSDEELFELMGSAIRFGREHGIEIDSAMQTDVPGYTWGLVSVLAKCGVKYMTMGPNRGHRVGRVYYWGERPFYWESPSGKEKVLCYLLDTGYSMFHRQQIGHQISEDEVFGIIDDRDRLLNSDKAASYEYDLIPIRYGLEGDNGRPNRVLSDVVRDWNEKYYYPKLVISQNSKFMRDFEARYGSELPTVRGDYTPYWEDGAASTSYATSINRIAKSQLIEVEATWAINKPREYMQRVGEFDAAWTDLIMYDEHTWGAFNSISEPDSDFVKQQDDYKQEYAKRGWREVRDLRNAVVVPGALLFTPLLFTPRNYAGAYTIVDAENGTIDNGIVSLKIDKQTGAIISLKMKGIENDLVNPGADGNTGLNDYLYIIGRDAEKNRERYDGGVKITATDDKWGLIVESSAPNCDTLTRTISLQPGSEVVEIVNTLDKRMERRQEGTFFGFPFNVPGGVWRVDTPWAMVQVEKDQLPGANRNYYSVQRFCNLSNDEYGIDWMTVHAPMVQFAPILYTVAWPRNLNPWRDHIEPDGTIYSWVCNNHWETNYKAGQDGVLNFIYKIRPYIGEYDAAKSQRFAMEGYLPRLVSRIVQFDNENVVVTRLKPARQVVDGAKADSPYAQGLIMRLYNPTNEPQQVSLKFASPQTDTKNYDAAVFLSNPWEDRLQKISPTMTIDANDMVTLRIE